MLRRSPPPALPPNRPRTARWSLSHVLAATMVLGAAFVVIAPASAAPDASDDPVPSATDALAERTGIVGRYLLNEFGEVDGVLAVDGDGVRFPPHMSRDLVATLKPGDRFVARGRTLPGGGFQAYALGRPGARPIVESRPSVETFPGSRDVRRTTLVSMTADGTVRAILRGASGDIDGIVLADGTIVKLPPRGRVVAADGLRVGTTVRAAGYGTRNDYGRCLRAEELGLDGGPLVSLLPPAPRPPPVPAAPIPPATPARPPG